MALFQKRGYHFSSDCKENFTNPQQHRTISGTGGVVAMNEREIRLIGKRLAMELPPSSRKIAQAILAVTNQEVLDDPILWPDRDDEEEDDKEEG